MEITHRIEDEILIFAIKGRLDTTTAPVADEIIRETLAKNSNRVLFDLSALEYLSSGGLRIILIAVKDVRRREGRVILSGLNPYVHEIFQVSGLTTMITIAGSVEEGIKDLNS